MINSVSTVTVSSATSSATVHPTSATRSGHIGGAKPSSTKSFQDVADAIAARKDDLLGSNLQHDLQALQDKVLGGQAVSGRELISYQIRAQEFGLRVELLTKLADAGLHTVRRLQQGQ